MTGFSAEEYQSKGYTFAASSVNMNRLFLCCQATGFGPWANGDASASWAQFGLPFLSPVGHAAGPPSCPSPLHPARPLPVGRRVLPLLFHKNLPCRMRWVYSC